MKHDKRIEELLIRAASFKWLARGFAYPAPGHTQELERMYRDLDAAARRRLPRLARQVQAALHGQRTIPPDELAARYLRLFLGNGPVSLHETAYGDGRRIAGRPVELADINGFYAAFGFVLSADEPDLPDHLCAELEFYSLLLVKEAYALSRRWLPQTRIARAAARAFLGQHLGRWIGPLKASLLENNGSLYLDLADTVETVVEAECKRLRVQPTPFTGRLPRDVMQDDSIVCPHDNAMTAAH